MIRHSNGNVIGPASIHCKIYRRELEYFNLLHSGQIDERHEEQLNVEKTMKLSKSFADHYKNIYMLHNMEVQVYFQKHARKSLFVGDLEDLQKWMKLGDFLGINVPPNYDSHENDSAKENERAR